MMLKPLAYTLLAASLLTACSPVAVKKNNAPEPFVFTEPDVSPPFYALNPFNYDAPLLLKLLLKKLRLNL